MNDLNGANQIERAAIPRETAGASALQYLCKAKLGRLSMEQERSGREVERRHSVDEPNTSVSEGRAVDEEDVGPLVADGRNDATVIDSLRDEPDLGTRGQ